MKTYSFLDVKVGFAGPTGVFSLSKGGVADEGITFAPDGNINTKTFFANNPKYRGEWKRFRSPDHFRVGPSAS